MTTTTATKPHISSTQLDMCFRCPEAYRRRYIEHEIIPPGIALLTGKSYHRAAEANNRQKIDSHADLPADQIVEVAVAGFEAELTGGYALTDDEVSIGAAKVLGDAKDTTAQLAGLYANEQAPDYQPVAVEHATRIVFPNATHDLLAITDLRDDHDRVTDFKTAARSMPASAVLESTQLTIYAAAFQIEHQRPPAEVRLDVAVKTKVPKRQLLKSERNQADFRALVHRVNEMLRTVEAGIFLPAPVGSWQCSPKWCGYWSTCRFVNSERRTAAEKGE